MGNFAAAEHFYHTALQFEPTNFDAIVNFGALMAATARGEDAVIGYRRALALDPDNVDALSNLCPWDLRLVPNNFFFFNLRVFIKE